jgi:HEAT repeat protein
VTVLAALSDVLVPIAQRVALATLILIGLLVLQITLLRAIRSYGTRRRGRIEATWEPALLSALDPVRPAPLPRLRPGETSEFLYLFNHHHGILAGETKDRLNAVAREAGVPAVARRMLQRRSVRDRMLALQTLGNLRDGEAWDAAARHLRDRDPAVSLSAARALARISPERAGPVLVPLFAGRSDWAVPRVLSILAEIGPAHWSAGLASVLASTAPEEQPRLIRLLAEADPDSALPAVRAVHDDAKDPEVVAAALVVFARHCHPDDLERIRGNLDHAAAKVRRLAVDALGRMGTSEDEVSLRVRLSDADGGIRYRAAVALASVFGMSHVKLAAIAAETTDPYAVDALVQVIEEIRTR